MGLRTWIYEKTGIKLKKFEDSQIVDLNQFKEEQIVRPSYFETLLLDEIRSLRGQVSTLSEDIKTKKWRFPDIIGKVTERELEGCIDLVQKNLDHVYLSSSREDIRNYTLKQIPDKGMFLEFGVFTGTSINHFARALSVKNDQRTIHGFDSFEGLSHEWVGWVCEKGAFDISSNLPPVEKNVELHKGWIDDTLPLFLEKHSNEKIAFIHIDVDIYEPAKTILTLCKDRLVPGSIILFDELIGYAGWRFHEFKALNEVFEPHEYEYIAFSDFHQAAIKIL